MHLIQNKLAGKEIPSVLPTSLIPPSVRSQAGHVSTQPTQPSVPEGIRDLIWDDTPPPSATLPQHQPAVPTPPRASTTSPRPALPPPSSVFGASDPFGSSSSPFTIPQRKFLSYVTIHSAYKLNWILFQPLLPLHLRQLSTKTFLATTTSPPRLRLLCKTNPRRSVMFRTNYTPRTALWKPQSASARISRRRSRSSRLS